MTRLIIFDDSVRGVDLPDRVVIVGRSLKADIPIHDRLLSRKHCTLAPERSGYRFLDLKSANGSYVNGVRVDKALLECDDVIEIGNTVMVLLESDTWERGEGLARLRNPVKAQELIQRIKRRAQRPADGRDGRNDGASRAGVLRKSPEADQRDSLQWAKSVFGDPALTPGLLEGFLINEIAALMVGRAPELRECLSDAMERVLTPESFQGGVEQFRSRIREAIRACLEEAGLAAATTDTDTRVAGASEADVPDPTPREESPPMGDRGTRRVRSSPASPPEDGSP